MPRLRSRVRNAVVIRRPQGDAAQARDLIRCRPCCAPASAPRRLVLLRVRNDEAAVSKRTAYQTFAGGNIAGSV